MLPVPDKEVSDHVYLWGLDVSSLLRVSDWMLELLWHCDTFCFSFYLFNIPIFHLQNIILQYLI
jgi:hypothetical protein